MKPTRIDSKITLTRNCLQISDELSFEEWQSIAARFGAAMSSAAFVIGDWIVYGEDHFRGQHRLPNFESKSIGARRVASEIYNEALRLTGLDRSTLITYAYVSRRVPASLRNEHLSWEHHKAVAKLNEDGQQRWLRIAQDEGDEEYGAVATRRLRKSITAGRLLTAEEMISDPADRGRLNHIPFLNRLSAWWVQMKENGWLKRATPEQKETLVRDLHIVTRIIKELEA